jgi:taurine--2-oxoglutarate transaminase
MGEYLRNRLKPLLEWHPSVGDVRGIGLFWAVEHVRDRKSKEAFNTREDKLSGKPLLVDRVASECMKNGTYVQSWISHLIIAPPLIVTKEEIDQGVNVVDRALALADKEIT